MFTNRLLFSNSTLLFFANSTLPVCAASDIMARGNGRFRVPPGLVSIALLYPPSLQVESTRGPWTHFPQRGKGVLNERLKGAH